MRSLDDWHKYVELEAKRVNAAKKPESPEAPDHPDAAPAAYGDRAEPLESHFASALPTAEAGASGSSRDDLYHDMVAHDGSLIERAREFELPALTVPKSVLFSMPASPQPLAAETLDSIPREPPPSANGHASAQRARPRPRGPVAGVPRKQTREELLARLLDPELTLEEAAQVLNVCPTTVRRYTNRGILSHYRTVGNQRRFRLSHVLAFLETLESPLSRGANGEHPGEAVAREEQKKSL